MFVRELTFKGALYINEEKQYPYLPIHAYNVFIQAVRSLENVSSSGIFIIRPLKDFWFPAGLGRWITWAGCVAHTLMGNYCRGRLYTGGTYISFTQEMEGFCSTFCRLGRELQYLEMWGCSGLVRRRYLYYAKGSINLALRVRGCMKLRPRPPRRHERRPSRPRGWYEKATVWIDSKLSQGSYYGSTFFFSWLFHHSCIL